MTPHESDQAMKSARERAAEVLREAERNAPWAKEVFAVLFFGEGRSEEEAAARYEDVRAMRKGSPVVTLGGEAQMRLVLEAIKQDPDRMTVKPPTQAELTSPLLSSIPRPTATAVPQAPVVKVRKGPRAPEDVPAHQKAFQKDFREFQKDYPNLRYGEICKQIFDMHPDTVRNWLNNFPMKRASARDCIREMNTFRKICLPGQIPVWRKGDGGMDKNYVPGEVVEVPMATVEMSQTQETPVEVLEVEVVEPEVTDQSFEFATPKETILTVYAMTKAEQFFDDKNQRKNIAMACIWLPEVLRRAMKRGMTMEQVIAEFSTSKE